MPGLQRSALVGGPAAINFNSTDFWSEDTFELKLERAFEQVKTSMFGHMGHRLKSELVKFSFTPHGLWGSISALFPAYLTTPVQGTRMHGDADVPATIWSNHGDLYTVKAAGIMKPPTLVLCADKPVFGQVEFVGVTATGEELGAANSLVTVTTAGNPGGQFDNSTFNQQKWTGAFGAVSGMTSITPENGFQVELVPTWEPVDVQGHTRTFRLTQVQLGVKCMPIGPTAAQLRAAADGVAAGAQPTPADLVMTGADAKVVTAKNMILADAGFRFGGKELRNGEVGFRNVAAFTAGALQPIITFA